MGKLPNEAKSFVVEVGKGTPRFFHIDADHNPVVADIPKDVADPGRTVMYVDDNPGARGVYVVADSTGSANDLVSLIETNKGMRIDFFYSKGGQFPHSIDFHQGDTLYSARLSAYNELTETYAMTLEADGEYESIPDLVLNKGVFDAINDPDFANSDLHDAQNARLGQIYITLGLYTSFGQMYDDASIVGKGWFSNFVRAVVKPFLRIGSIVCTAVALVLALPPVIALVSVFSPVVAAALPVVAEGLLQIGAAMGTIGELIPNACLAGGDAVLSVQEPSVIIKVNGVPIPDDPNHVYTFDRYTGVVPFDIEFVYYPSEAPPKIYLYNPKNKLWIKTLGEGNAYFFDVHNGANVQLKGRLDTFPGPLTVARPADQFTVKRNNKLGRVDTGHLDLVLYLGDRGVLVNGAKRPIDFFMPNGVNNASTLSSGAVNYFALHLQSTDTLD
jgi:hypothetical protein